jgi:EmrB/QacA subfamily drug resistance transporter
MSAERHRPHYNVTFALLAAGAVAYALLQSMVAPALLEIQHDLGTTTSGVAWVLTAYLLSASVITPIAGRLGDMFGKKRVLVIILFTLAVGTAVSGIATTLPVMILGRVIQGAGGAIFPLAFSIIRDEFPPLRVPQGIALISAILAIGGGLGIVLAGPIVEHFSYHWLFWFPLIAVLVAAIGTVIYVPESPIRAEGRVDWIGALLLAGWLIALLVGVSQGSVWGWTSARVLGLFCSAVVLLAVWIRAEMRIRQPLVDMKMMRLRGVWTTNLAAFVFGFGMYSSFVLVPEFVEQSTSTGYGFGASITQAGLYMLPATVAMMIAGPISGRLSSTVGSRVPLIAGSIVSTAAYTLLAFAHSNGWQIYLAMAAMGFGIGLAFASMANLIVEAVPAWQTGVATGMNTIVRTVGGAIGTQIAAGIVTATSTAAGIATERGFTIAFAASAVALAIGVGVAFTVPRRRAVVLEPASELAPG